LSTRYHKALALQGAPGSGKSTFISLLESIFPDGTVSHVGPSTWDDDDKLGMLITAKLNTVSEASKGAILAQDRLKSVLGGEGQTVVRKWEKAATFYPRTAHLFAFNTWPTVPGADASFWDRWACLTLRHRVRETGEEVKGLAAEIARDERPGLVAWAVEGARSLLEKDGYTIPPSSAAALAEWQQHADSLGMWLASEVENINVGGKHWTPARTAFKAFCEWAAEGRYRAMNETTFGTRLVERGITKKKISSMRYAFTLRSEGPI
jgi:putative DNA primase/helicase